MEEQYTITAVIVDEQITYTKISQEFNIPESLLLEMEEQGLFKPILAANSQPVVNQQALNRIQAACRIHQDLQVNLPGVALALELLDELEVLRQQLAILER